MSLASGEEILPEVPQVHAIARWRAMVERRRIQMEAAYARAGIERADYWGRRAKNYRAATHSATNQDPFVDRVLTAADRDSSVIDVGCGTGRHTLALAPRVRHVTAVDPSPAMLGLLRQDLADSRIGNVAVIEAEWLDAETAAADVVICSHVLYPIADVVPFVEKLEASATRRVFVYIRADPVATDFGLWSEFHGVPLEGQPTHRDLFGVLIEMGIMADIEIVATPFTWSFGSVDEAAEQLAGGLCLRDDDAAAHARLRTLISERFLISDGRVSPRVGSSRSAIFSWEPRHAAHNTIAS